MPFSSMACWDSTLAAIGTASRFSTRRSAVITTPGTTVEAVGLLV
jgi:hypothetical protein